jgi:RNA polymerase sigma-70 factor, ECF subfamily
MRTEPAAASRQDELYRAAAESFGAALERLARGYEADPDRRRDLLQDIHLALWRSLSGFDGRCSVRTWVYRVAHNVAASYVAREQRRNSRTLVGLDALDASPSGEDREFAADQRLALDRILQLIQRLRPLDRQVILSYLEGLDAMTIAEITGLSPGNVATRISRIKDILARWFHEGDSHGT